jgi:hypothetical protein
MGLCFFHSRLTMHKNLPYDGLFYVQLQTILLNSEEYECNRAARKRIGGHFEQVSTSLAMLVHSYATEISIVHVGWLTKSSLSKRTNGGGPLRLAVKCSLKILSISSLRSAGSRCWSSNFIMMSRLNWSNLVNTAITGTRKMPHFNRQLIRLSLTTYHSYPDKCPQSASNLAMADHWPSKRNTRK